MWNTCEKTSSVQYKNVEIYEKINVSGKGIHEECPKCKHGIDSQTCISPTIKIASNYGKLSE